MITKIQSITDVITNSSSSVFVIDSDRLYYYYKDIVPKDCLDFCAITYDWLIANPEVVEMVCTILEVDPAKVTTHHDDKWGGWWETPDEKAWITFLDLHKQEIEEKFANYYWVEIEDHFENAYEITRDAYGDAIWSESWH